MPVSSYSHLELSLAAEKRALQRRLDAMTTPVVPDPPAAKPAEARDLLPCPFCGGRAERQELEADECDPNGGGSFIECDKCGACSAVHFDRKENLVDSWNRRTIPTRDADAPEVRTLTVPWNPCLEKLRPGEPFFVLLGRDPQAPDLVMKWMVDREDWEGASEKTASAREVANAMERYRLRLLCPVCGGDCGSANPPMATQRPARSGARRGAGLEQFRKSMRHDCALPAYCPVRDATPTRDADAPEVRAEAITRAEAAELLELAEKHLSGYVWPHPNVLLAFRMGAKALRETPLGRLLASGSES